MTFTADSPVIRVNFGMINQSSQSIVRGLWPQWIMYVSGIKENNRYFRPDVHGVNEAGWNKKTKDHGRRRYNQEPV